MGLLLLQNETKVGVGLIVLIERGYSDARAWKISRRKNERGKSPALAAGPCKKWEIIHARVQTGENPRSYPIYRHE